MCSIQELTWRDFCCWEVYRKRDTKNALLPDHINHSRCDFLLSIDEIERVVMNVLMYKCFYWNICNLYTPSHPLKEENRM